MTLERFKRLAAHARWADTALLAGLRSHPDVPADVLREFAHVLGATEVWLSRLEQRAARAVVWPTLSLAEAHALAESVHAGWAAYLQTLREDLLDEPVPYTNTAGQAFRTPIAEILLQMALHGQYHRGKINLLLRQAGLTPVPTDYIAFARGVPAARIGEAGRG
jgi:uncharacterized damage-inducible protein DinB